MEYLIDAYYTYNQINKNKLFSVTVWNKETLADRMNSSTGSPRKRTSAPTSPTRDSKYNLLSLTHVNRYYMPPDCNLTKDFLR